MLHRLRRVRVVCCLGGWCGLRRICLTLGLARTCPGSCLSRVGSDLPPFGRRAAARPPRWEKKCAHRRRFPLPRWCQCHQQWLLSQRRQCRYFVRMPHLGHHLTAHRFPKAHDHCRMVCAPRCSCRRRPPPRSAWAPLQAQLMSWRDWPRRRLPDLDQTSLADSPSTKLTDSRTARCQGRAPCRRGWLRKMPRRVMCRGDNWLHRSLGRLSPSPY